MPTKQCEVCHESFHARLTVYRTCSTLCRNRLIAAEKEARNTHTEQCVMCGAAFVLRLSEWQRVTCSDPCARQLVGLKLNKQVTRSCVTCSKEFSFAPCQLKVPGGGTYCSRACMLNRNGANKLQKVISANGEIQYRQRPEVCNFYKMKRNAQKLKSMPPWADPKKIAWFYAEAQRLVSATGVSYDVDHIVPLQSKLVCGLHWEGNLQLLPAIVNRQKYNSTWPDKP